jgi:hypothetical protein
MIGFEGGRDAAKVLPRGELIEFAVVAVAAFEDPESQNQQVLKASLLRGILLV